MNKDIKTVLFSEESLKARVQEIAGQITADFAENAPLVIGVLKGSFIFMADLVREIEFSCTLDFIAVSSYRSKTSSTGAVQILKDLTVDITGRDIIIIEDILDTGLTLSYLIDLFKARGAKTIRTCALLDKPSRRKTEVVLDYVGFEVPNEFVVGYGLDFDQQYRNLPYIGILHEHVYQK